MRKNDLKFNYYLCGPYMKREHGRIVNTNINLDVNADFDSFLRALYKRSEISEEELNTITSAYYA